MSSFSTREEPGGLVVTIEEPSALNDFRSNSFRDALYETCTARGSKWVAVDLGRVDFLSSSGVAILVGLKRRVEARQCKLVLYAVQPVVLDLLRLMHLTQYFAFADGEKEALAMLRPLPAV